METPGSLESGRPRNCRAAGEDAPHPGDPKDGKPGKGEARGWAEALREHCGANPKYTPEAMREGARLGDGLIRALGSWERAVETYRAAWKEKWGNNLDWGLRARGVRPLGP